MSYPNRNYKNHRSYGQFSLMTLMSLSSQLLHLIWGAEGLFLRKKFGEFDIYILTAGNLLTKFRTTDVGEK